MPNYRRFRPSGGTFFFTLKTENNAPIFSQKQQVEILSRVFREAKARWPFDVDAVVLLPDHLHAIWSLPAGDDAYSTRWAWLKKEFTRRYLATGGAEEKTSQSRQRNRRRGVWQRRFWEHTIGDEDDFYAHFDYIHWNPVKHGYVNCPAEWPHSSFHRWAQLGVYPAKWGCRQEPPQSIATLADVGE
jgi:putative transposase